MISSRDAGPNRKPEPESLSADSHLKTYYLKYMKLSVKIKVADEQVKMDIDWDWEK